MFTSISYIWHISYTEKDVVEEYETLTKLQSYLCLLSIVAKIFLFVLYFLSHTVCM